ncbi:MAG: amino acid permease, partial [Gemmatimonadota bacterium]
PVLFSVGGWENLNMVAGEVRNPAKLIPRALALGIAIIMVCYLGVNVAYLHVLGRDGMAASSSVAADTAIRMVGSLGGTLITIAAMVSILGLVNVVLLATPRIFYAMSREGLFYPAAARIHPRFGTPHISIAMLGLWSVALLLLAQSRLDWLLNGEVFADWIFFGLSAASVFVFRRTMPDRPRPYRAWGYPVVPLFFVAASLVAVLSALVSAPIPSAFGAFSAIVGAVVYALFSRRWKASPAGSAQ